MATVTKKKQQQKIKIVMSIRDSLDIGYSHFYFGSDDKIYVAMLHTRFHCRSERGIFEGDP